MESTSDAISEKRTDSQSTPTWMKRVPMVTGVLAGLAGFLTVKGTNMSNQAIYNSNQAVLHQAMASDHWSEYQADSVKRHINETTLTAGVADPVAKKKLSDDSKDLRGRQDRLDDQAKAEEALRDQELMNGQRKLAIKDLLDYAGVAAQLGIALSSVAALTKKKSAFTVGVLAGVLALLIAAYAISLPFVEQFLSKH